MLFYPFLAMLSFKNITNRQLTMPCTISPAYRSTICTLSVQQIALEVQWMFAVVLVGIVELGILAPPDAPPSTTGSSLSFQHIHHHYSIHISLPRTANVQIFVAIWTACPCQAQSSFIQSLKVHRISNGHSPCTKYMLPMSQFLFSCHVRVKWQFTSYVSFKWRLDSARGLFLDQTDLFVNLR